MHQIYSLIPDDNKHSICSDIEGGYSITFYKDDVAVARRDILGKSQHYIDDVMTNWLLGVLDVEHFTLEERLRA